MLAPKTTDPVIFFIRFFMISPWSCTFLTTYNFIFKYTIPYIHFHLHYIFLYNFFLYLLFIIYFFQFNSSRYLRTPPQEAYDIDNMYRKSNLEPGTIILHPMYGLHHVVIERRTRSHVHYPVLLFLKKSSRPVMNGACLTGGLRAGSQNALRPHPRAHCTNSH